MSAYILTPYDATPPWAPALSVDQYEDVTGRPMGSEKPESDLLLIRCDKLTAGQITTIKANGSYFVLEDGQASACQTFLSGKKSGHGVQPGDTVPQMRDKLITWCRNLPLSDGIDPTAWRQPGDVSGAFRTTDVETVSRTGGGALVVDEQVNAIASQDGSGVSLVTAGEHVLWGGDHIKADHLISGGVETGRFLQANVDIQVSDAGFVLVSCFSFTGIPTSSTIEAVWLDNHDEPFIQFNLGDGRLVYDAADMTNQRRLTAAEYNDGQKHAYAINYDRAARTLTFHSDAGLEHTLVVSESDAQIVWDTPAMVCGNRAGIAQNSSGLVFRNRTASEQELADMMTWVKG